MTSQNLTQRKKEIDNEKIKNTTMKHRLLILSIFLVIIFANSCREATYLEPRTENILIKDSLGIVPFTFDTKPDSVQKSLLHRIFIINSIEALTNPFETFGLEVPEDLERYDYENYTFLLRFCVYVKLKEDINHKLTRDRETGIYSYYILLNEKVELNPEIFFFYTGILVPKISDESEVIAWISNF
jgi:hypothetical protein